MHSMRRKDRQITDLNAIRTILDGEDILHLALCDGDMPYVVPMSYGYEMTEDGKLTVYLHCAGQGQKLDMMRRNPNVCFEISRKSKLISSDTTAGWTAKYRSLIGRGKAVIETTDGEKAHSLMTILRHAGYKGPDIFEPKLFAMTTTVRIEAESYTAKSNIAAGEEDSVR